MMQSIRSAVKRVQYLWRPFAYWLAPVIFLAASFVVTYFATTVQLSEKLQPYSVFFLILAFLVSGFFLLITAPCVLYSGYLSVWNMLREKRYVLPGIQLALNIALLVVWWIAVQKLVL